MPNTNPDTNTNTNPYTNTNTDTTQIRTLVVEPTLDTVV